jgi:hypothetical protein
MASVKLPPEAVDRYLHLYDSTFQSGHWISIVTIAAATAALTCSLHEPSDGSGGNDDEVER